MHIARCQHRHINQSLQLQHSAGAILWIPATHHHGSMGGCQEGGMDSPRRGVGKISSAEKGLQLMFSPAQDICRYNPAHHAILPLSPRIHPLYGLLPKFLHAFSNFSISLKRRLFLAMLFSRSITKASLDLLCCLFLSVPPSSTMTASWCMLH